MKEIFLLTKTLLKSSTSDLKQTGETKTKGFGRILFFILIYGYVIGFMGYISYYAIDSLIKFGKPEIFLNLVFTVFLGFGIIQAIISSLNVLYFSKDLEFLLPLPMTANKIVISKLNCLIVSQYLVSALLVLPGLIVYGYLLKLNICYYIIGILGLIIFPIIPVSLVAFIISFVMKFTKIIKNKDIVQYFTIVLTVFLVIAVQSLTGNNAGNPSQEELAINLIQSNESIENNLSCLINVKLVTRAIQNYNNVNGIKNICILTIISGFIYYIVSNFISKVYVNTVLSLKTVKTKKIKNINFSKSLDIEKTFAAYIKKEFKLLTRNPIFFMQCVLPILVFPILIGVPAILSLNDTGVDLNGLQKDLEIIMNTNYGIMGFIIAIIFMYVFNYASVTSVSRDGQNAIFMKYIPIDLNKQILYKAMPGIILNIIPTIYVFMFALFAIPSISANTYIFVFIITLLINILNNLLSVIVDLKNPKLKWISEYTVVKQNFNMIFSMLFVVIEIGIILLCGNTIINTDKLMITLIVIFLLINVCIKTYIHSNKNKIFNKII